MNIGGPALHVLVLAAGLKQRGYEHILISGSCEHEQGDMETRIPFNEPIVRVGSMSRSISLIQDFRSFWTIYRLLRRERPMLVHTHTAKAGCVGRLAAFCAGVPVIVHTFHGNSLNSYFSPLASVGFRLIERALACITDQICVVSNQQKREICELLRIAREKKVSVVPLGLDLSRELNLPIPSPKVPMTVGWLGRLVRVKGVDLLAEVVEEAARRELPIRFIVGGDGPEQNLVKALVARRGSTRVHWLGWTNQVQQFLGDCDLLLQTSRNEGTPVALIQGMAAGRPFVSTPAGGVVDLVSSEMQEKMDGSAWYENGVLAEANPAAMANALEAFCMRPSRITEMGECARTFASRHFQGSRLIDDVDRLYQTLIARERLQACESLS